MSNKNEDTNNQSREWTLPVMDSAEAEKLGLEQGFDTSKTGAWTSFAIGAVTKSMHKERDELLNNPKED